MKTVHEILDIDARLYTIYSSESLLMFWASLAKSSVLGIRYNAQTRQTFKRVAMVWRHTVPKLDRIGWHTAKLSGWQCWSVVRRATSRTDVYCCTIRICKLQGFTGCPSSCTAYSLSVSFCEKARTIFARARKRRASIFANSFQLIILTYIGLSDIWRLDYARVCGWDVDEYELTVLPIPFFRMLDASC